MRNEIRLHPTVDTVGSPEWLQDYLEHASIQYIYVADLYRRLSMLMEESTTYQAILEEGDAKGLSKGLRSTILRIGTKRFGPPSAAAAAALQTTTDTARLEALADGILDATSWDELLAGA